MTTVERRFALWLDFVGDLLERVSRDFPHVLVARELAATFGCRVSWNWADRDGSFGSEHIDPMPGWPTPEHVAFWREHGLGWHPLVRWFELSGDASPMSTGRIPPGLFPDGCFGVLREQLGPYGLEENLSIPYRLEPDSQRAFVLARGDQDFPDEDYLLARRLQPLLALLERQVSVLRRARDLTTEMEAAELSGRELVVLRLLGEGRTAEAMARELGISVRTVQKHLEHVYRKLGVSDRLRAVLVAREAGIGAQPSSRRARGAAGPRPVGQPATSLPAPTAAPMTRLSGRGSQGLWSP
jgi:DNA-binding CsgD family transcriptional regulator